jgi:hypothetical protein
MQMATTNPITGQLIMSKPSNKEYEEGWQDHFANAGKMIGDDND